MIQLEAYHDLLQHAGLTTLEGVKRYQGELVKNQRGRRDILRIAGQSDGQPVVLYLKRIWKPYRKDGLFSLLKRRQVWSIARQEWENMLALQRIGLLTAELVAYGEECGPLWEKFSFIITRAAPPSQTVEDLARDCRDPAQRRRVIDALARQVRKMHDSNLATPDLFARHFFVDEGEHVQFWLIDMARLDHESVTPRLRARDLAALHVGLPLRYATLRERLRFLRTYAAGKIDRQLLGLIDSRSQTLLRRTKFRDFARA